MNFIQQFRNWSFARRAVFLLLVAGFAAVFILFFLFLSVAKSLPTREQIVNREISQSTKIYDRTGQVVLWEINGGQKRTVIPFDQIPQSIKDATISLEEENFYNDGPIEWKGILRALYVDLTHGQILQGGSTITQQLAKNAFLSADQTIIRKAKELLLAIRLSKEYSKDEVLGLYLNEIPYGPTVYGIESASQAYFGKSARDLTIAESAVLAAIPRAPSYYYPWGNHAGDLLARQKFVLKRMHDLRKISDADYNTALAQNIQFKPQQTQGIKAPHFVLALQDYLVQRYGEDLVRTGGLRVISSLDWDMQQAAEKAVKNGALRNTQLYNGTNAALVAEDPQTGQILAMVGSRDYFDVPVQGSFNVATQGLRQPGSALKPFVYMTAFQNGFTPDTVLFDLPTEFSTNSACPDNPNYNNADKRCFHPQNFDNQFHGPVLMKNALPMSMNVPAVKTLYLAGEADVIKNLNNFGISTLDDPNKYGLSLTLGGGAVRLIDLVKAYSTLSQDGVRHDQSMILEVRTAQGDVVESYKDNSQQVIDPQYPRMITSLLSDPSLRADLFHASLGLTIFQGYDLAMKTGTSNDYRDAWTMGYTPNLVVGVWAGNNDNSPLHKNGSSILAAVPIWHDFLTEALKKVQPQSFTAPDPVSVEKPVLRGDFAPNGQIHDILYWVNKNDPQGAVPQNPDRDPEFHNWEAAVLRWAAQNPYVGSPSPQPGPNPSPSPQPSPTPGQTGNPPRIQLQSPAVGATFNSEVRVAANIGADSPIQTIRVLWNGDVVQEFSGNFGTNYSFNYSFVPDSSLAQNLLELEVEDAGGLSGKVASVVYH